MCDASFASPDGATPFGRPRPAAPHHLTKPPGRIATLLAAWRNPIEAISDAHFKEPFVELKSALGSMLFVSDPESIAHVMVHNASNYHKDRLVRAILEPVSEGGLLISEDDQWRAQRRMVGPLFTPKAISSYLRSIAAAASEMVEDWGRHPDGHRLDVAVEMARFSIEVLQRTIFPDGFGRSAADLHGALSHYFDSMGSIDPVDIWNMPNWVPRIGPIRARRSLRFFSQMTQDMVETRKHRLASSPDSVPNDLLSALMRGELSERELRGNIMTFFATGFESATNALVWSLYLLSLDPEWRKRIEEEADRELPTTDVAVEAVDRLVVTRAVIEEAMRLYPPVPAMGRQAIGPDRLGSRAIDAGTIVVVSPWVLHRHELLWHDPDHFDPSRFMPDNRKTIDRYAYLPFGCGPRVCIGQHFALQEVIIALATVVRSFRCDVAPGHRVWPYHRISLRPRAGMPMLVHRRSTH